MKIHEHITTMVPTVGDIYISKDWMNGERKPLGLKVTRIAQATVYVRPWYGLWPDGSEWLGALSHFPLTDVSKRLQ